MARFVVREGWVVQAYRYALDPSPRQERALASHAGAARVAYNWAVTWVLASWAQRKAEESYGVPEDERTPWRSWSLPALRKGWNQVKDNVAPWWAENSKEAYSSGLAGAAAAFGNYAASKNGRRKGPPVGCPRRKTKHRSARSCRFTTGAIRVEGDRHHVTLPRLGAIRTHESTRKLARRLEDGRARILSATVRQEACGPGYVSLQAEVVPVAGGARPAGGVAWVELAGAALASWPGSTSGCRTWLSSLTHSAGSDTSRIRSTWSRRCPRCVAGPGRWHGGAVRSAATRPPARRSGRFRRPGGVRRGGRWPGLMSGYVICGRTLSRSSPAGWRRVWPGGCCGPERGRDAAQPAAGPAYRRCRVRRDPAPARLQERVERRAAGAG